MREVQVKAYLNLDGEVGPVQITDIQTEADGLGEVTVRFRTDGMLTGVGAVVIDQEGNGAEPRAWDWDAR